MHNRQIYEEASEWFTRMRDGEDTPAARSELMTWFRRSPEHVSAYLDIAAVWMESKNVSVDAEVDLETRIAQARADLGIAELIPRREPLQPKTWRWRTKLPMAMAASAALVLMGIWFYGQRDTYTTGTGEQHSIALSDGSTVELNSRSRLKVRFTEGVRNVELLEGQALFRVAKNPTRPFIVATGDTRVRAVGTQFDVYRKSGGTIVTVIEGRVAVISSLPVTAERAEASASSPSLFLTAGERLTVAPRTVPRPTRVNVAAATAWTQRQLVFEFTPLGEAAEEFNRYNARQLVVEGEALRAFKISAIFRSTDPASLVRYIQTQPGIRIQESEDTIRILPAGD